MLILFSYPGLFGLSDNNPYGLKVATFLRLCAIPFRHEHIFDAASAPRGQLPYIDDDGVILGDSGAILNYIVTSRHLDIDADLKQAEHDLAHLVDRMLDDLYWVMSYARWRDPRFWPLFRDEILKSCPEAAPADLEAARQYNFERYRHQGIGRFEPEEVYARGVADLGVLARLINDNPFFFGEKPHGVDAAIFGFLANIYFYEIETPLKRFVAAAPGLARHCERIRALTA